MKQYRRMTYTDRLVIEKLYNSGCSYRAIAQQLGFSVSSVHYEVKRGLYLHRDYKTWKDIPRYSATIAHDNAQWQATAKGGSLKLGNNHAYAYDVASRLKAGESPDSIVGSMRNNGQWTVSTVTLYRYIEQGFIPGITNKNLLVKSRSRKRPYRKTRACSAPRGVSIEKRPEPINERFSPGHWEMDTVIGKAKGTGQTLLVLTERLTRYEIICKLQKKTACSVENALSKVISRFPAGTFKTLTVDNGTEFSSYESLKSLVGEVYYCHPYSSYERGSNENANRLIRRFFPKGKSMEHRTQADCDAAARFINNMHRKVLGYATAAELFDAWQQILL
ncbi:IS30 family transposase [Dysosmobacter sp.]|uniref:IS30 family transposase n=1 Tax=Dysosmobacter sp. TaxID=2591382 RepID=UPI002A8E3889|nr:IS30 family transposase [Dysosmobacter sp.]MDY3281292.1 IS30 family transposase [Dysosmobacter sp.]